ncbi:hypothetical protein EDD11_008809 [Mortierella claussenii]|nr:hypothetical protein EDD11_008809 [Mortierella claussenii]
MAQSSDFHGPLGNQASQQRLSESRSHQSLNEMQQQQPVHHAQRQRQDRHSPALPGGSSGIEHDPAFNAAPHSPFVPQFMHPNVMLMMQQQHIFNQQQQQQHHNQQHLSLNQPFHQDLNPGADPEAGEQQGPIQSGQSMIVQTSNSSATGGSAAHTGGQANGHGLSAEEGHRPPMDRPRSMDVTQLRQRGEVHHPGTPHPMPMFNMPGNPVPPGFDNEFGGPGMVPMPGHFLHMNRMAPPPGFGHFPMHPMQGPPPPSLFQSPYQQQQFHHQQQQMFMHQQMLRQQQQIQQQIHQQIQSSNNSGNSSQHPLHPAAASDTRRLGPLGPSPAMDEALEQRQEALNIGGSSASGIGQAHLTSGSQQQDHIKSIESQINHLLFKGDSAKAATTSSVPSSGQTIHFGGIIAVGGSDHPETLGRPLSGVTVQEIEEAQVKDMQNQMRRISLNDPVSPPRSRFIPSVENHISGSSGEANVEAMVTLESSGQNLSSLLDTRFHHIPQASGSATPAATVPRYEQVMEKTPFSVKDIDFYSDRKYDPYRPSVHAFDLITRDAKALCHELMPKPEEETRKLALLQRLSNIANEVFGEAEVLPFGSSGNGLALANADMDVCVFLKAKEGEDEVSPVEFVERIGDRLEEDSEFENILQLKRARVPIVKLNHINGIACDIGYQNDLAIWNTRLLRAYCKIDGRLRDMVVVVKTWAKRRKINNPYTGSLSSYAYVLLVIHVLQRRGVLPNLQSIVAVGNNNNNGKIPFWDCQGFNRYFFEDIPSLSRYWQATPEAMKESVGELLYEFFRYFASEFRYASHVVSIRSGGLMTKEAKEWTKDHTQPQQQSQVPLPAPTETTTPQTDAQHAVDAKPIVKNRYLFCIEDPFELDHNVGRPVDRYSLFTIRGEFMRAAKILSRNGDGAITRLCQEREVSTHQERNRNSSIDHGDDHGRDKQQPSTQHNRPHTPLLNTGAAGANNDGRRESGGPSRTTAFPAGEDKPQESESPIKSRASGGAGVGTGSNDHGPRQRSGRREYYKRSTIASEPRTFTKV